MRTESFITTHYTEHPRKSSRVAWLQMASGLILIAIFWRISWQGFGSFRHQTFFGIWLGYILTFDALTLALTGSSLLHRLKWRFILLFFISIPFWWLFEAANERLGNWEYILPHEYGWFRYHAEASIAFSTVVPAVFVTAEFVRAVLIRKPVLWIRIAPSRSGLAAISIAGAVIFGATMLFPELLFPLVWLSLFLAIDPLLALLGGRSISDQVRARRWDTVLILFVATLTCGFFWEMWNSRALPKWEYEVAYADWFHIFEMPLLGYGGYLPFGLELYALANLVDRLLKLRLGDQFRFDQADSES